MSRAISIIPIPGPTDSRSGGTGAARFQAGAAAGPAGAGGTAMVPAAADPAGAAPGEFQEAPPVEAVREAAALAADMAAAVTADAAC